jgi:hypothetical protein
VVFEICEDATWAGVDRDAKVSARKQRRAMRQVM